MAHGTAFGGSNAMRPHARRMYPSGLGAWRVRLHLMKARTCGIIKLAGNSTRHAGVQ